MRERRFTMDRRTFIKTTGGLVIMKTFAGRYSPAHAAKPPSSLEFKGSVGRWLTIGQSGGLDSAQQGQITVTPQGQNSTVYALQDGSFSFNIPNSIPSEILLEVNGMSSRSWGTEFQNDTLVIANHDYNDTPLVYHWMELDNAYVLEYWQDDLLVTGPADPGGYYIGYLYAPLNPLEQSGRLNPVESYSAHETPPPAPTPTPPDGSGGKGQNGLAGIPDNNVGVSTDSSPEEPAGTYEVDSNTRVDGCSGYDKYKQSTSAENLIRVRAGEMVSPEEIRIPIIPSLAALEQNQVNPRIENLNFGAVIRLDDPSGSEMGTVFVGLNNEAEIAGGVTLKLTHLLSYPIDQIVINSSWPKELLADSERGSYKMTFWAQTTSGLSSNKRFVYAAIK